MEFEVRELGQLTLLHDAFLELSSWGAPASSLFSDVCLSQGEKPVDDGPHHVALPGWAPFRLLEALHNAG